MLNRSALNKSAINAPLPVAHKFWRVKFFTSNGAALVSVAELQMRATPGGADQCTGGTASASTEFNGTLTAAKAFDNDLIGDSFWASNTAYVNGQWIRYEFATPVEVQEIALFERQGETSQGPRSGAVEWSDDGSAWTEAWQWSTYGWRSVSDGRVFTNPAFFAVPTTTHWRMAVLTNGGSAATALTEMQMRTALGGADQCTGGTAFTNDTATYPTLTAANAFDNDTGTLWAIGGSVAGSLGYVFASAKRIVEVALTERSGNSDQPPRSGNIEYSTDGGASWGVAFTFSTGAWAGTLETRVFSDPDFVGGTTYTQAISAALTVTTLVPRKARRLLAAALTATAAIREITRRKVTASLTGTATLLRTTRRALAASLTAAASTTTSFGSYAQVVGASLTATTTLLRKTLRRVSASLTASATVVRFTRRALTGSLTSTAALVRRVQRQLLASLTSTTVVRGRGRRRLLASLTVTALGQERVRRALQAAVTGTATLRRRIARQLLASLTLSTALASLRYFGRMVTSSLTGSAVLRRQGRRPLTAALTLVASLTRQSQLFRQLAASLTTTARVGRQTPQAFTASLTPAALLTAVRKARRTLSAALIVTASLAQELRRTLGASIVVTGMRIALTRTRRSASTGVAAQVSKRGRYQPQQASLTVQAGVLPRFRRAVGAVIAVTRSLLSEFIGRVEGWSAWLPAQVTLQSRYDAILGLEPSVQAALLVQARHTADIRVEIPAVQIRLDA